MVRGAERGVFQQRTVGQGTAGRRVDAGHGERFGCRQRGQ